VPADPGCLRRRGRQRHRHRHQLPRRASEEILGELLAGRRDRFVLATKYTVSRDRDDPNAAGNHRKNMRLSLDTSLQRLRTDYLDIYWVHM
jgi:aryl-alcohol dehydrogenase-like predicted oxidoreductase